MALALAAALGLSLSPIATPVAAETVQEAFIRGLVASAQQNQRDTAIPASVAIGQAALETGWGRSSMAQPPINSYFSIKCGSSSPHSNGCVDVPSYEYDSAGNRYLEVSSFRTYATVGHSLLDYGRLLTSATRYKPAFQYANNPDEFIRAVRKAGYATDPAYAETVISIMSRYDLYRYDLNPTQQGPVAGANPDWVPKPLPAVPARPAVLPEFVPGTDFPAYAVGSPDTGGRTLQLILNEFNQANLEADGIFGRATDAAVVNWQNRVGAKATGVMDDQTWTELLPRLEAGARGGSVTALQQELTQAGFSVPATGSFDAATVNALKAFQQYQNIQPTGIAGSVVWARLLDW